MKINLDRLCKLAGIETSTEMLSEAGNRSYHEDPALDSERTAQFADQLNEEKDDEDDADEAMDMQQEADTHEDDDVKDEMYAALKEMGVHEDEDDDAQEGAHMHTMEEGVDDNELIEVDEAMLVQEIRRARKLMAESAKRAVESPDVIKEQQLRQMIAEELDSVLRDLNLTSGWVYGKDKPQNSKDGFVNQGFMGTGFKK